MDGVVVLQKEEVSLMRSWSAEEKTEGRRDAV